MAVARGSLSTRQATAPFSIRFSSHVICGRVADSNIQASPLLWESRRPQHGRCPGLISKINVPKTSNGLCSSCNLISALSAGNNDSYCASRWTMASFHQQESPHFISSHIIRTPYLGGVITVKTVHVIIKFVRYIANTGDAKTSYTTVNPFSKNLIYTLFQLWLHKRLCVSWNVVLLLYE